MTFAEIEKIVGSPLPNSKRYPAWWSNNPFNNVMTQVWLDAGFATEQVDVSSCKLVFRKTRPASPPANDEPRSRAGGENGREVHPLLGWMKGTVQIPPGVDLTTPADPDWSTSLDR
jgi:hypothetical protein